MRSNATWWFETMACARSEAAGLSWRLSAYAEAFRVWAGFGSRERQRSIISARIGQPFLAIVRECPETPSSSSGDRSSCHRRPRRRCPSAARPARKRQSEDAASTTAPEAARGTHIQRACSEADLPGYEVRGGTSPLTATATFSCIRMSSRYDRRHRLNECRAGLAKWAEASFTLFHQRLSTGTHADSGRRGSVDKRARSLE